MQCGYSGHSPHQTSVWVRSCSLRCLQDLFYSYYFPYRDFFETLLERRDTYLTPASQFICLKVSSLLNYSPDFETKIWTGTFSYLWHCYDGNLKMQKYSKVTQKTYYPKTLNCKDIYRPCLDHIKRQHQNSHQLITKLCTYTNNI